MLARYFVASAHVCHHVYIHTITKSHTTPPLVTQQLPRALDGVFMRVGPNPYFPPLGNHSWLDGDGMVHAIRIANQNGTTKFYIAER